MAPVPSPPRRRVRPSFVRKAGVRKAGAGQAGFTLIELMVVVILVSILAVMATPAMLEAKRGRRAYEDAATIMMLFKNARSRAIGDQAAVMITLTFDSGSTNLGVFREFESTFGASTFGSVSGGQATMAACTQPSSWDTSATGQANTSAPHPVLIEGYNMQEPLDQDAHVHLFVTQGTAAVANSGPFAFCFTPSGRMYTSNAGTAATNPVFTEATMQPTVFTVKRDNGVSTTTYKGPTRNVLVMPSGATRLYST
jgi:prepilin-type N-terminal cleavage/methylation domain-containing protein